MLIAQVSSTIERNQVIYALPKSETRYRGILEDRMELICRFLGDRTLIFNEAYYHFLGQDRRALIGHFFPPFIAAEDKVILKQQLASLNRENPVLTAEFRVTINDEIGWQRSTLRAIFDFELNRQEWDKEALLLYRIRQNRHERY